MSALNSVAVIICVCSISCSIISIIAPKGKMSKTLNLVLGLFLICSILIPLITSFKTTEYKFNLDERSISFDEDNYEAYDELVLNKTADNLVVATNELLLAEQIEVENIEIGIKKSDNNSIYINKIIIYITTEYEHRAEDIRKIIGTNMMKEPVIIVNED